jgi:hypothetical protein
MQEYEFGHILLDKPEILIASQVIEIRDRSRYKVINPNDPMSLRQQIIRQMRP